MRQSLKYRLEQWHGFTFGSMGVYLKNYQLLENGGRVLHMHYVTWRAQGSVPETTLFISYLCIGLKVSNAVLF
jgi:hypothetical protein